MKNHNEFVRSLDASDMKRIRVIYTKKVVDIRNGISRAKARSKTFPGIANAMAEQWSKYVEDINNGSTYD